MKKNLQKIMNILFKTNSNTQNCKAKLSQFIKKFDLIAPCESLKVGCRESTQTKFGAILTISVIILTIIAALSICDELFLKEKPKIFHKNNYESESPLLDLNQFTFAIRIENEDFKTIANFEKYFKLTAYFEYYTREEKSIQKTIKEIPLMKCRPDQIISDFPSERNIHSFDGLYCLNYTDHNSIYGNWNSQKIKTLSMFLKKCIGSDCAPESEIDKLLDNYLIFSIFISDAFLDNQSYDIAYKNKISSKWFILSKDNFQEINYYLKKLIVKTDIGFIRTFFKKITTFQFESSDIKMKNIGSDKILLAFYLLSSNYIEEYFKLYMKIQDCMAQLGGIISFFLVMVKIITFFYKKNQRDIDLINK